MGYAVGDLRTSSGHGDAWIGVPVQCYTEGNKITLKKRDWSDSVVGKNVRLLKREG